MRCPLHISDVIDEVLISLPAALRGDLGMPRNEIQKMDKMKRSNSKLRWRTKPSQRKFVRVSSKDRRTRDGHVFSSLAEARRYDELIVLQKSGDVVMFLLQPRFELGGGIKSTADFQVFWADGHVSFEDVKSKRGGNPTHITRHKRNKALVESRYPISIEEVYR